MDTNATSLRRARLGDGTGPAGDAAARDGNVPVNPTRRQWRTLAAALGLGSMLALSAFTLREARVVSEATRAHADAAQARHALARVRAALAEAVAAQRSHLLTGRDAALSRYRDSLARIATDVEALAHATPDQATAVADLRQKLTARIDRLRAEAGAYREEGLSAAQRLLAAERDAGAAASIDPTFDAIDAGLREAMYEEWTRRERAAARLQYGLAALATTLLAALAVAIGHARRRRVAAREAERRAEATLAGFQARMQEHTRALEQRSAMLLERARRLEERSAQLEKANRDLESFTYAVSHDLRAPLRTMSGFAQRLARGHRDALDEQGRHFLDRIAQASTHMVRLIDDLLSYSRLGHGKLALHPVPLSQVIQFVAETLAPRIGETGAALDIPADLPAVDGSWTLLSQIFTNLVDNALTYTRPDVPPRVTVTWSRRGGRVVVSLADNGIGIAPEHRDRIFHAFQRLHSQEQYPGTGIGLAIVRKAVELQRGRLWLDSEPGAGTTFHVELAASGSTRNDASVDADPASPPTVAPAHRHRGS